MPDDRAALPRRRFLNGALALAGIPPLCCTTQELPPSSLDILPGKVAVHLDRVPALRKPGAAFAVVSEAAKLNLILIHARRGQFVAMNRSCTHGGAQCAYNAKRETVQCTSLNHAEYDLEGTLLHGRTHGNLRTYRTTATKHTVEIHLETRA